MNCGDILGNTWRLGRLLPDTQEDAVQDDVRVHPTTLNANETFIGEFLSASGTVLPDLLVNGRCFRDGIRHRIEFTRQHVGGLVTTFYSGRVTKVSTGEILIRGRYNRNTTTLAGGPAAPTSTVVTESGDYETEKPT